MKLKPSFTMALDLAPHVESFPASIYEEAGQGQWSPVAIRQRSAPHRASFTLPAVPRPLTPRDREYFRALRQAEIKAWLAADRSTPESRNELIPEPLKPSSPNPKTTTMKTTALTLLFCLPVFVSSAAVPLKPAISAGATQITSEQFNVLRSGDLARLTNALSHGLSPNARDAAGNTPLMHAAVYSDLAALRLLIDRGADVNATNNAGATALMRAAYDWQKIALLLDRGADVNARSAFGNTALMLAARPAHSHRAVQLLLSHSADAKATNNFGATALMAAAAGGDKESVRLLVKNGANVNAQPSLDQPGFIFGGGRTPLMWAAYRGDTAIMKLLMDAGAEVNLPGVLGTPLSSAAWADRTAAARLLIERGANVNQTGRPDGYSPLHWAASTENDNPALVNLLLQHGADPNLGGGENIDAFMDVLQTPLMLARRRGDTKVLATLLNAGATNETPDRIRDIPPPARELPARLNPAVLRAAINDAIAPLQETSIESKRAFLSHGSKQDCTSCHQQFLPMAALGVAKRQQAAIDSSAEEQLVKMVQAGELKNFEFDWQALFHPDAVQTKGYALFGFDAENLAPDEYSDSAVHHLSAIQGKDGQWYNNLPRPPIQTGDIGATALAIHALQQYGLPGRKAQFAKQVEKARAWLWKAKPENTDSRIYQILGLAWAGEPAAKLKPLADALLAEQRPDGGWAQLPSLKSDAYATGQAIYALRAGAALQKSNPAIDRGLRYLLSTQLADGTWHVHRRAFPFQPTMQSGFPHSRDSWISAAGTSWAVMALALPDHEDTLASGR